MRYQRHQSKVPEDVEGAIACTQVKIREEFGNFISGLSLFLSLSRKKKAASDLTFYFIVTLDLSSDIFCAIIADYLSLKWRIY